MKGNNIKTFYILMLVFAFVFAFYQIDSKTSLQIQNINSHPRQGKNWTVFFNTKGKQDLQISLMDQRTQNDLSFIYLMCADKKLIPEINGNEIIFKDWECDDELSALIHRVNHYGNHYLRFKFGNKIGLAHNSNETTYDMTSGTSSSHYAYYGKDTADDIPVDTNRASWNVAGTEFTAAMYGDVESSDNSYATTTDTSTTTFKQVVHDFVFTSAITTTLINSLQISWEGESDQNQEVSTDNDLRMYLYNDDTSAFILADSEFNDACDDSDCTMTYTTTTDISSFFNGSDQLRFIVQKFEQGNACNDASGTCYATTSGTYYPTACTYQASTTDNFSECATTSNTCASGNCIGTGHSCGWETSTQDTWSECSTSTGTCWNGSCSGSGFTCGYWDDNGYHNCNECYGCLTGNATSCEAVTGDYPTSVAYGCIGTGAPECSYCSSGTCGTYTSGQHGCNSGYECDGSGVCTAAGPDCFTICMGNPNGICAPDAGTCSMMGGTPAGGSSDCVVPAPECCCGMP